ncbi:formin-like protein 3 [Malania oleifera]|uniref:formin-like protein 3 n=1 Tax=Malania oleifera TaxID=397392 RepID=UPI0025ADBA06|nr:formin-like protein 3 [Malania oleifera]
MWESMDARRVGCGMIFVIFLCALAVGSAEGTRRTEQMFFGNGRGLATPEIDENTAEQMWIHCRQELMERVEIFEGESVPYFPWGSNDSPHSISLAKKRIHNAIRVLPPQMQRSLLDCLRKKTVPHRVLVGGAVSGSWLMKHLELLFGWPYVPRRCLAGRPVQGIDASPAPAPALSPAFPPSLAVKSLSRAPASSIRAPANSPSLNPQTPTEAPEPFFPPTQIAHSPPPPLAGKKSPPILLPKKHDTDQKETVVLVAAAVGGALVLVALCCFCCVKGGSSKQNKDERPLLTLSMSDFSTGSSQKSISLGSSNNKELRTNSNQMGQTPSFVTNLSVVADVPESSPAEAASTAATADVPRSTPMPPPPLKPPPGRTAPPSPAPPPPPPGPRPPPPPKGAHPPPLPPKAKLSQPSRQGPHNRAHSAPGEEDDRGDESGAPKPKLKPFFWDKVLAKPDQSMVWHEISAGSFQFNEEMIESLFGYPAADKNKIERKDLQSFEPSTYIQIIDSKKAQNLSILLRALNVTIEEVRDALLEGNELPTELLQTLLKMAPTAEEELKLRLFSGELSQLGPAERFLKALVDIPFSFKRMESLLFMSSLQEDVSSTKESCETLEVACKELRNSRLFLKLLEAVLKTGNRMNIGTFRGGAQAFKLDTLLKLSDVKGADGKITLLHFVVQEIIRSEGKRAARTLRESHSFSSMTSEDFADDCTHESEDYYRGLGLQVVSGLSNELENVRKASVIDADGLTATVSKLGSSLMKTRDFLNSEMEGIEENSEFHHKLARFVSYAEEEITSLLDEEKRIMALVKSTADYFHGNAGKDEGLRLFMIVRDFLIMLEKACKEVRNSSIKPMRTSTKEAAAAPPSSEPHQTPLADIRQRLFPAIAERRTDNSSSDDESLSP